MLAGCVRPRLLLAGDVAESQDIRLRGAIAGDDGVCARERGGAEGPSSAQTRRSGRRGRRAAAATAEAALDKSKDQYLRLQVCVGVCLSVCLFCSLRAVVGGVRSQRCLVLLFGALFFFLVLTASPVPRVLL